MKFSKYSIGNTRIIAPQSAQGGRRGGRPRRGGCRLAPRKLRHRWRRSGEAVRTRQELTFVNGRIHTIGTTTTGW